MKFPLAYALMIICFFLSGKVMSQAREATPKPPIQVDVIIGHNKTQFQSIVVKPLDNKGKLEFFNLAFFDAHYAEGDKEFNEGVMQTYVAYNFIKGVGIGLGGMYNNVEGVAANVVAQFVTGGPSFLVVVYGAAQLKRQADYEVFSQIQYRPLLTDRLNLLN